MNAQKVVDDWSKGLARSCCAARVSPLLVAACAGVRGVPLIPNEKQTMLDLLTPPPSRAANSLHLEFYIWKKYGVLPDSFGNYNWIFAFSLAFNLTNLKSRGYPDEELGGQEKSRTTQEQENSKLDFRKLHYTFHFITIGFFSLSLAVNLTNLKSNGYPYEESDGQEKSRTTQEQGNSKLDF
ncbi:hypothetical protein L3X38_005332 [Prunus dulcis]|uniref:Uncharacterized protein n=1 Tax=Prunus dulcis TaxID=3755 RepID=A0AAD5F3Y4_PRUDU|nr:hypothetical protein L3X38_005332 [Prunus dulcis]